MKKIILNFAFILCLTLAGKLSSAQTYASAIQKYQTETGSTLYNGEEIKPEWYGGVRRPLDLNGDGKIDCYLCFDEFRLFGHVFWQSQVWFEDEQGNVIPDPRR